MNNTGISISNRATSGFPLSIGTAIAMESLFPLMQMPYDPERKIPTQYDLSGITDAYFNVTTLFRNFVSSLEKIEELDKLAPVDIAATLEEEIEIINQLFENHAQHCKPHYYHSEYSKLKKELRGVVGQHITLRVPSTEKQKIYERQLKKTLDIMSSHTDTIVSFSDALSPKGYENAIVLTHIPYDLTSYKKFSNLDLVESNTGVIKPRKLWNTKYHVMGGQDISFLPFHRKLLLIFGDRVLIKPASMKFRQTILEIAVKHNWNPMTTKDKINIDVEVSSVDPYLVMVWKAL